MKNQCDICVVGAGISGLAVASFLRQTYPSATLLLVEKQNRPGGAIHSYHQDGYLAEWGPHGFLDNCQESKELIALAGLQDRAVTAPLGKFVRYLCLQGQLAMVPQSPLKIIGSNFISWGAKGRVLAEWWQPPLAGTPSVAKWVEHRFGKALLPFADAIFTGTYAGDIEKLRIDAVMPGVREMEKNHGSVLRALVHKKRTKQNSLSAEGRALPAMTSFSTGMEELPLALAAKLVREDVLLYNTELLTITPAADGWQIKTSQGECHCQQLILALSQNQSLSLLAQHLPQAAPPIASLPESQIASVLLGFSREAAIPFGFGYLAPEREQRFALGALFSTHMFPGRAPAGKQLIEVLVGGRRHTERLALSDQDLIKHCLDDVGQLIPQAKVPEFHAVLRPSVGIPQLEDGALELLAWRERLKKEFNTLHLCGFGWKGIGLNDMIKEAKKLSQSLTSKPVQEQNEVKGIYF